MAGPISLRSNRAATLIAKQLTSNAEVIPEGKNEGDAPNETKEPVAEGPSAPATNCVACAIILSDDEITINQRFIDQALASTETSSLEVAQYPLCVKCLFERLTKSGQLNDNNKLIL